jgi:hypothetical protein
LEGFLGIELRMVKLKLTVNCVKIIAFWHDKQLNGQIQVAPIYPCLWNETWYLMNRRVVEIQSRSKRCGEEKILVLLQEVKFNIFQLRHVINQTLPKYLLFLPSPTVVFLSTL